MHYRYAQILVEVEAVDKRTFSYIIPDDLIDMIHIGIPVLIPFGNRPYIFGYVVGFSEKPPSDIKLKSILQILGTKPVFDLEFLKFLEWVSDYYCCSLTSLISTALPHDLWNHTKQTLVLNADPSHEDLLSSAENLLLDVLRQSPQKKLTLKTVLQRAKSSKLDGHKTVNSLVKKNLVSLKLDIGIEIDKQKIEKYIRLGPKAPLTKRQTELVALLKELKESILIKEFCSLAGCSDTTIDKMIQQDILALEEVSVYRTPLGKYQRVLKDSHKQLNKEQKIIYDKLIENYHKGITDPILIHGITGSGKTEIYMQVMDQLIREGKSIIFMLPEITLASHITLRVLARFDSSIIAIWHSTLSDGERLDSWSKIYSGEAKIIIGTRSSIFTPAQNIGMIVVDECHDSSYKQESQNPRYNAVTLALERAKRYNALCVLGTATPNTETFYQSLHSHLIYRLTKRATPQQLPNIVVVNMKDEIEAGNRSLFSRYALTSLKEVLENKNQSIILVNRRGFATYTTCTICSYVEECPRCTISLVYHNSTGKLRCHYCNYVKDLTNLCPNCGGNTIRNYGIGSQRVEEEVKKFFSEASIMRLDSDITSNKNIHNRMLEEFSNHQADILVGTQMIAKGLDIPNVTLVIVVSVDSILTMPDFRSDERGFQLLTQIAGRAGRGTEKGQVIFQAYDTENEILHLAKMQDYQGFYEREIEIRESYFYPPFSQIIRILASSEEPSDAIAASIDFYNGLTQLIETQGLQEHIEVYRPVSCVIGKINNRYRMHIMIKNRMGDIGRSFISRTFKHFKVQQNVRISIDVDPLNLL